MSICLVQTGLEEGVSVIIGNKVWIVTKVSVGINP